MSKKSQLKLPAVPDTPYRRIAILAIVLIAIVLAFFAFNLVARGFGGNEKKLVTALLGTLKEPYINGEVSLSQKSQTNTFNFDGAFQSEKLNNVSLDATIKGELQDQKIDLPIKLYGNVSENALYVQLSNTQGVVDVIGVVAPMLKSDVAAISEKIDGKWLRTQQQKNNTTGKCGKELLTKLADDEPTSKALMKVYSKNRFLKVDKVEDASDGARNYTVSLDSKSAQSFMKAAASLEELTSISVCKDLLKAVSESSSQDQSQAQEASDQQPQVTQVVTVKDGKIVGLESTDTTENQVSTNRITLNFNKGAPLQAPVDNIVDYKDIEANIAALGGIFQQQMLQAQQSQQQSGAM